MTRECFSMRSSPYPTEGKDIRLTTMLARSHSQCGWSRGKPNSLRQQEQFVLICCPGIRLRLCLCLYVICPLSSMRSILRRVNSEIFSAMIADGTSLKVLKIVTGALCGHV